ncbi:hypothetical protein AN936_03280 [Sphingopyxis macrogoltabida]|uniref:Uncharacterized protein n=1 Tax=Sphingopyxis macrogoltabida TaxID=33050 RepID=A0A0N9U356_SPHMC|nr:hypothetical protein AN936_03280 [Sphingopyxis macrogoltabida]
MRFMKLLDPRTEPQLRERRQDRQPHRLGAARGRDVARRHEKLLERWKHALRIALPRLGQPDALRIALKQFDAEIGLERLDPLADRTRRHAEFAGGEREALGCSGRREDAQPVQIR